MLATLIVTVQLFSMAASPTVEALLLDTELRQGFVDRWAPCVVKVGYKAALQAHVDPARQPMRWASGVLVRGKKGPMILAPDRLLRGARELTVRFSDGLQTRATLQQGADPQQSAVAQVVPVTSGVLDMRDALVWSGATLQRGRRAWALEYPANVVWDTRQTFATPQPVLVDTVIEEKVEWPLERFRYVSLKEADGLGLLDEKGRLLCIVFRSVPGSSRSLCAPRDAALAPLNALGGRP